MFLLLVCETLINHDILRWSSSLIVLSFAHTKSFSYSIRMSRMLFCSFNTFWRYYAWADRFCRQLFAGHMVDSGPMRRMKKIASNDNFLCCVKPKPRSEPVTFQTGSRIDLGSRILIVEIGPITVMDLNRDRLCKKHLIVGTRLLQWFQNNTWLRPRMAGAMSGNSTGVFKIFNLKPTRFFFPEIFVFPRFFLPFPMLLFCQQT